MNTTLRPARAAFETAIAKMLSDLAERERDPGVSMISVRFTREVMPIAMRCFADEIDAETDPDLLMATVAQLLSNMLVTCAGSMSEPEARKEASLLLLDEVAHHVLVRTGELPENSRAEVDYHPVRSKGCA